MAQLYRDMGGVCRIQEPDSLLQSPHLPNRDFNPPYPLRRERISSKHEHLFLHRTNPTSTAAVRVPNSTSATRCPQTPPSLLPQRHLSRPCSRRSRYGSSPPQQRSRKGRHSVLLRPPPHRPRIRRIHSVFHPRLRPARHPPLRPARRPCQSCTPARLPAPPRHLQRLRSSYRRLIPYPALRRYKNALPPSLANRAGPHRPSKPQSRQ